MNSNYRERFLRNIGIMNEEELLEIKNTSIAIAGLGLGGSIFINLVRMGFEKFHVADPDHYERTNVNRQRMAKETTIGCRKDDALLQEARAINPDICVKHFPEGVKPGNVDLFLDGMHWVVDAVDVFAFPDKIALHNAAQAKGLPVISCVAIGFGAAVTVFNRDTPSFCEVAGVDINAPYETNMKNFAKSVTPEVPNYMVEQVKKALKRESHIPFVVPGVEFSAAIATTEITRNLLGLGNPVLAPKGIYIDAIEHRFEEFNADYRSRV